MERFFIDIESGSAQGRTAHWVVPPGTAPDGTLRAAHRSDRGHITRPQSRSGSTAVANALRFSRNMTGCHVLSGALGHGLSVSGSNGCELHANRLQQESSQLQMGSTTHGRRRADGIKLSIAMAAHNEEHTIAEAITQVLSIQVLCEIELIVVDDGSTDDTLAIVRSFDDPRLTVVVHSSCMGKGASVLDAVTVATGTHLLVFDADLEYSAEDIPSLIEPILNRATSVVYGTRVRGSRSLLNLLVFGLGSKLTTIFTNMIFGSRLRDMHTCLKLIPLSLFRQLTLSNSGFGLDTEISCELLRRKVQPIEVSCSYHARSVAQGKQIGLQDGLECLKIIVQVRLRRRLRAHAQLQDPSRVLLGAGVYD